MKNAPLIAASATVLLHAGLLVAVIAGLAVEQKPHEAPETLKVRLLAPVQLPLAVAPPAPPQPVPMPLPPKKERVEPRPRAEPRTAQKPTAAAPVHLPETSSESKPSPATVQPPSPLPATAGPAIAAPAPPAPPARTSASEASYASANRKPPYPRIALSNGDEGTVILRVLVTAEGTAGAVEIKSSSGYPLLDESARKTVQTWRFKPATVDGKPVTEWYQVPIPFKLQNN
jgi:periplasmic protein TonB